MLDGQVLGLPKKCRRYYMKSKEAKRFLSDVSNTLGTEIEQFIELKSRVEVNKTETAEIFFLTENRYWQELMGIYFQLYHLKNFFL